MRSWIPSSSISTPQSKVCSSILAVAGDHELLVLRVPFDVVGDEGTQRNDVEILPTRVFQRGRCEAAAEAATLARFVHLRVREGDAAASAPVGGQTDQAPAEPKLVAARLRHVDDLRLRDRSDRRLELVGSAEKLDQLPRRIRFAGVAVIGEPPAVDGREGPRLTLVQVRKDLARAAVNPTVLGLQDRDLVRTG